MNSLPWPTDAPVLPIATVRPVLDRLTSLGHRHAQDVTLVPGLATTEEEVAADPPPALEQITDELGGIEVRGLTQLDLLVEDRTDVGPYTLLDEATSFYPLYESPDTAVILTLGDDGAPGAVYGIGEDLALQYAAPDLGSYLERFADALEATVTALDEHGDETDPGEADRTDAAERLMDQHLFRDVLGLTDTHAVPEVPLRSPEQAAAAAPGTDLPAGTVAVADLREAPLGARVDVIDADLPGDPLEASLAWRAGGRIVCIIGG